MLEELDKEDDGGHRRNGQQQSASARNLNRGRRAALPVAIGVMVLVGMATERFVLRSDYTFYTAFLGDTRVGEYRAVAAGISFFF